MNDIKDVIVQVERKEDWHAKKSSFGFVKADIPAYAHIWMTSTWLTNWLVEFQVIELVSVVVFA